MSITCFRFDSTLNAQRGCFSGCRVDRMLATGMKQFLNLLVWE